MNIPEYEEMYKLESFYWWFVARRRLLDSLVSDIAREFSRPIILDVGCGTGINYSVLSKHGETFSSDAAENALRFSKSRGIDGLVRSQVEALPFGSSVFDIVTALDMLEHVDDDLAALDELLRVTNDRGKIG